MASGKLPNQLSNPPEYEQDLTEYDQEDCLEDDPNDNSNDNDNDNDEDNYRDYDVDSDQDTEVGSDSIPTESDSKGSPLYHCYSGSTRVNVKLCFPKELHTLQKFLDSKDKVFLGALQHVDHDGYDEEGPESNLYDLYVFYRNECGEIMVDNYHYENWYQKGDEDNEYELWGSEPYKKFLEYIQRMPSKSAPKYLLNL
jgi:hypothetical protein